MEFLPSVDAGCNWADTHSSLLYLATMKRFRSQLQIRFLGLLSAAALATTARGQGQGPAIVAVSPVVEREVTAGQTFVGTVMPLRKAVVGSAVDGRVMEYP